MTRTEDAQLAELAEAIQSVSRKLHVVTPAQPDSSRLSPLEALVMRQIATNPGITPSRLAGCLGLKSSNASAALRVLEGHGLIVRTADPADARSVRLEATATAAERLAVRRASWAKVLAGHLGGRPELGTVLAVMTELDAALDVGDHPC